jgi:hypothetical protein
MKRIVAIGGLAAAVIVPGQHAAAQDSVGGALMGATIGGYAGGMNSGRAGEAIGGMISGGTAGAIIGSDVEKRRGYAWRDGNCYRNEKGRPVRVTRRYCY